MAFDLKFVYELCAMDNLICHTCYCNKIRRKRMNNAEKNGDRIRQDKVEGSVHDSACFVFLSEFEKNNG